MSEENKNKDIFELMLASQDSSNSEQFPVLKAFQSYLDAEREKARKRQSQITICFLVSTIVLVICFCVVGFAFFSKFIEKDNQLTQLLLLERAGVKTVPQQTIVQPQPQQPVVVNSQVNELSDLIAELKREREALEVLKADISKKQQEVTPAPAPAPAPVVEPAPVVKPAPTPVVKPTKKTPVEKNKVNETKVKQGKEKTDKPVENYSKQNAVATPTTTTPTTTTPTTTTTTTTTTSTTSTTTTIPQVEKPIEVEMPKKHSTQSVPPNGYFSESMKVVTENNVYVPWHVLLPDVK